jgi:hypothetical protein
MTGPGHRVDHGVLDGISSTLRHASTDVDGLASSVPSTPDAGNGTAAIANIMAKLVDNAGQFVIGTAAAADAVGSANSSYAENDVTSGETIHNTGNNRAV